MTELVSYCTQCDAPPGGCDHTGPRYLDPIVYEQTEHGWKVPDHERERWNSDKWRSQQPTRITIALEPKLLRDILTELETHVFLSDDLRSLLHDSYDTNPHQTTLLADHVRRNAAQLQNPAGLLVSRLRQITPTAD